VNINGIYDGLVQLIDSMQSSGFLSAKCRNLVNIVSDEDSLLRWLDATLSHIAVQ
jgi:predicted Rossmann-fold nucleotide-binding protein